VNEISYHPIGIINSPFKTPDNMPIQNTGAKGVKGTIELFREYTLGLKDLEGFSHLILIYHLHLVNYSKLLVKPFMDTVEHGIFSTRSPARPNPIGITTVKLIEISGNIIFIEDLDILDQTPLLDIKPYLPLNVDVENLKLGWLQGKIHHFKTTKSDDRFVS
jgi:tRNA-Thr(GGU) m(6)t(6)A37 methyltransferase TsaA